MSRYRPSPAVTSGPFRKLPGFVRFPPGLERTVLRRLPAILLLGTLSAAVPSIVARLLPWGASEAELALRVSMIDIFAISAVVLHWTIVLTVAIGASIVLVMKGPAYVADAYRLQDADTPKLGR